MPKIDDKNVPGVNKRRILENRNGVVRIVEDTVTGSYSIGIQTRIDVTFKTISKELYDLLLKELGDNPSITGNMVESPYWKAVIEKEWETNREKAKQQKEGFMKKSLEEMEKELGIDMDGINISPGLERDLTDFSYYEEWYKEELFKLYEEREKLKKEIKYK